MAKTITIGEARIRVSLTAGGRLSLAEKMKRASAELINLISQIEDGDNRVDGREVGRLKALAMTAVEEASMWATKAETSQVK